MQEAFPEACVRISSRQLALVPEIPDVNDKHVIAAAMQEHAQIIVTFNLRHFPMYVLKPLGIAVCSPDKFLVWQFRLDPERMKKILDTQAIQILQKRADILKRLNPGLPKFVALFDEIQQI